MNTTVHEKYKFYFVLSISFLWVLGCGQNHPKKAPAQFKEYIEDVPLNKEIVNELKVKTAF